MKTPRKKPLKRSKPFRISAHGRPEYTLPVTVVEEDSGDGYGVHLEIPGFGSPVYLELDATGVPVLRLYAEPSPDEEPSHTIYLPRV